METVKDHLLDAVEVLAFLSVALETGDASRMEETELRGVGGVLRGVWTGLLRDHELLDSITKGGRV